MHLPPFKAAFDAGAITVMSSFNDINGVPASANAELLTDILRGEWKFPGVVISDYTADMELVAHGYAADDRDATAKAFTAGLDLSMQSGFYAEHLPGLVESGEVPMAVLDEGVRRILWLKETIGLFDDPYRSLDPAREADTSHLAAHDELSRDAARRSIVLLNNRDNVLPLQKTGQKIALIGPFVQDRENIEGCWTLFGDKQRYVDLETGVRAAIGDEALLEIVPGCELEAAIPGGTEAAVAAALRADVVVLALGEPQRYSGEAQSRVEITLPPAQQALAEAVAMTGKPLVVLLRNGRALALQGAVRNAQAVAVTWYLGTQTGHAVADVLFGDYSPSGRLPVSFRRCPASSRTSTTTRAPAARNCRPCRSSRRAGANSQRTAVPVRPWHRLHHLRLRRAAAEHGTARLGRHLTITTVLTNTGRVARGSGAAVHPRSRGQPRASGA